MTVKKSSPARSSFRDEESDTDSIQGKTLRVYWWLMEQTQPKSKRQIREGVRLSSVSLASYHLRKLEDIGLIKEVNLGDYEVIKEIQVGMMQFYTILRKRMIPRFVLYASFYVVLMLSMFFLAPQLSFQVFFLLSVVLLFGIISSLFETHILLKSKPF